MARFYMGQRVRIKWSKGWPELAGQQGIIVCPCDTPGITGDCEWIVTPDGWDSPIAPYIGLTGGSIFSPNSSQLEPLTDCYDTTTWDQCVWRPEHMRSEA